MFYIQQKVNLTEKETLRKTLKKWSIKYIGGVKFRSEQAEFGFCVIDVSCAWFSTSAMITYCTKWRY